MVAQSPAGQPTGSRACASAVPCRPVRPGPTREGVLFGRLKSGDASAREELVERFLPLAEYVARRFMGREPLDDLVQVASIGLVKAIDRYDSSRGAAFSSYAVPTIMGELKRYLRDSAWAVHVPRGLQERVLKVNGAVARLSRDLGRTPSTQEVASSVDQSLEAVLEAMEAAKAYEAAPLETAPGADGGTRTSYAETVGAEDPGFALVDSRDAVSSALRTLPRREQTILQLRIYEDLSQTQIGERIGVSQMHVSRLKRRALKQLHEHVEELDGAREA